MTLGLSSLIYDSMTIHNDQESFTITVHPSEKLVTKDFHLYRPSYTQIMKIPSNEAIEFIKTRRQHNQPSGTDLQRQYTYGETTSWQKSSRCECKCLLSEPTKTSTLADRMARNYNKLSQMIG